LQRQRRFAPVRWPEIGSAPSKSNSTAQAAGSQSKKQYQSVTGTLTVGTGQHPELAPLLDRSQKCYAASAFGASRSASKATEMPIDKTHIRKGAFLTGGNFAAAPSVAHAPLPPDLAEFESACREADRLAAQRFVVLENQLADARKKLDEIRAFVRRR
jgi:hypothetical protein